MKLSLNLATLGLASPENLEKTGNALINNVANIFSLRQLSSRPSLPFYHQLEVVLTLKSFVTVRRCISQVKSKTRSSNKNSVFLYLIARLIQYHLAHGASKELKNPCQEWILEFL